jgi:cellulose synthase/poly-beta-1,6-N-acetylglucosamine synthase-like glycosyltransferase
MRFIRPTDIRADRGVFNPPQIAMDMRPFISIVAGFLSLAALPYAVFLGLYALIRPMGSPADKQESTPSVSVVLPTYNEARIVESKLDELVSLDYPMELVEIVVADASDDGTTDIVREYFQERDSPSLTLVRDEERRGVAAALNDAIAAASGEGSFRTDADSRLTSNVLREATANLADPNVGAVTGQQIEVLGDSTVEEDYRGMIALVQSVESRIDSVFICHGPCFAFSRELFEPLSSDTIADDTAIGVAIRRGGKRVIMDPSLRFTESGISDFGKRRARKDRRAMGLLQLLFRNRDAVFQYGLYGWFVLPFSWLFMIVTPWLFAIGIGFIFAVSVALAGPFGLVVPAGIATFVWLGQRDALGPLQPPYAVVDSQVSLLIAALRLLGGEVNVMWDVDRKSREVFE